MQALWLDDKKMNIIKMMELIKSDGNKILQDDCIFQLRAFMRGFVLAKNTSSKEFSEDQKIMERIDKVVRKKYSVLPTSVISVEEIMSDFEGRNAYQEYLKIWFLNV